MSLERKLRREKFRKYGNKKVKALQHIYNNYAKEPDTCKEKRKAMMKKL